MADKVNELRLDEFGDPDSSELVDAFELAGDQDGQTWVTDVTGKRIAVIAPVAVAEYYEQMIADVLGALPLPADEVRLWERIYDELALYGYVSDAPRGKPLQLSAALWLQLVQVLHFARTDGGAS
jgi:hypothetical protein